MNSLVAADATEEDAGIAPHTLMAGPGRPATLVRRLANDGGGSPVAPDVPAAAADFTEDQGRRPLPHRPPAQLVHSRLRPCLDR